MWKRNERRRAARSVSRFPMRFRLIPVGEAGYLEGTVEDLSGEGVRFRCPGGVRARSGLLLEMLVPGGRAVHVFGRAAWVRDLPGNGGVEVGGGFVDQSTTARKAIERHLKQQSAAPGR